MRRDIGHRLDSFFDAFEEILHMAAGLLAFVEFDHAFFDVQVVCFGQIIKRFAGKLAAVNENATTFAFEQDSVFEFGSVWFIALFRKIQGSAPIPEAYP